MSRYTFYLRIFPNQKVYVGCTVRTVEERAGKNGIQYAGQRVYDAIEEFGWDSVITQILEVRECDEITASKIENEYIKKYKSDLPEFGYNSILSPRYHNGSKPLPPEACKKIGQSKIGRIWCYKGDDIRFVTVSEWENLREDGYIQGVSPETIAKKSLKLKSLIGLRGREGNPKRVAPEMREEYLSNGWILEEDYQKLKEEKRQAEIRKSRAERAKIKKRFIKMDGRYRFLPESEAELLVNQGLAVYEAPKHTEADKAKISAASRAHWEDPEYRAKVITRIQAQRDKIVAATQRPEVIAKRAAAIRASHQTPEYKAKASASLKGRIWITNGIESRTVIESELAHYLENGWRRGRTMNTELK